MAKKTINQNDLKILNLKKEIEEKKSKLSQYGRFDPKTNCSLTLFGKNYPIHTLTKESLLLLIAQLTSLSDGFYKKYPDETLIIDTYPIEDWLFDLETKFGILNVQKEKERLTKLEEKLHNLLSIDSKISLELDQLSKQI